MAECNHTILSHGTYSFWAGFLANGYRVIPSMVLSRPSGVGVLESVDKLKPFDFSDKGLRYAMNEEQREKKRVIL